MKVWLRGGPFDGRHLDLKSPPPVLRCARLVERIVLTGPDEPLAPPPKFVYEEYERVTERQYVYGPRVSIVEPARIALKEANE